MAKREEAYASKPKLIHNVVVVVVVSIPNLDKSTLKPNIDSS